MKDIKILLSAMLILCVGQSAYAEPIWSQPLSGWGLVLRENTGWVSSTLLPGNCSPLRAEIRIFGTDYDKALFNLAMAKFARGHSIEVLVDDTVSECIVLGLR